MTRRRKHNWFKMVAFQLSIELDQLKECVEEVNGGLKRSLKRLDDRWDEETAGMSEEQKNGLVDFYAADAINLKEDFPQLTNAALFLGIFSLLEHKLLWTCGRALYWLELADGPKDSVKVEDHWSYLVEASKGKVTKTARPWKRVLDLKDVRNVLVHQGGRLGKPPKGRKPETQHERRDERVRAFMRRNKSLKLDAAGGLVVSPSLCLQAIEAIRGLYDHLRRRMPKARAIMAVPLRFRS